MATKIYNKQVFTFVVNGDHMAFYCETTNTRSGFCHHAYFCGLDRHYEHTRVSYYNRTWERFDYESTLLKAIDKLPKALQAPLRAEVAAYGCREAEKAEAFIKAFENNFNAMSDEQKAFMREHTPHMDTKEQAYTVAGFAGLFAMLNAMRAN